MLLGPTSGANATTSPVRTAAPLRGIQRRTQHGDRIVPVLRRQADADVVLAVPVAEPRWHDALDHAAQLRRDVADAEAHVGGERSIHASDDLGLAALQIAADVDSARNLADLGLDFRSPRAGASRDRRPRTKTLIGGS